MKYYFLEALLLTSLFFIGCSSSTNRTMGYYQKTELHNHVFKYKDCEDKLKHKHGGKQSENIVIKTHKHHLTGSCQSLINERKKHRNIDIRIKEPLPPQLPSNFKCSSFGVKEGTAECNKLKEVNAR